jgi:hypothetical protein
VNWSELTVAQSQAQRQIFVLPEMSLQSLISGAMWEV